MRRDRGKPPVGRAPARIGHKCVAMGRRGVDVLNSVAAVDTASAGVGVAFEVVAEAASEVAAGADDGTARIGRSCLSQSLAAAMAARTAKAEGKEKDAGSPGFEQIAA